jgi:tetratricopeptide (TPR) repeat protein
VGPRPEPIEADTAEVIPEPPTEIPAKPPASIEPAPPEPEPTEEALAETPTAATVEPEKPEVEKAPAKPAKFKEPLTEPTQLLQSARQALGAGDAGRALSDYRKLIDRKQDIDTVIKDLQRAAERYPNLPKVWQALGDAYMKADQLPEAIKAYKRGMEVA